MHTWVHCHLCVPKCTIVHHPLHMLHVWSMQGGTPGRHHLRRLHRPPRRRPAPRSQLQPQHQPPASPRPGTLRNRTPPVATVQERAQRGYGGDWRGHFTCGGRCRCVWVAPVARTCTRAPSGLLGGGGSLCRSCFANFCPLWPSPLGWQCTSGASPSIFPTDFEAAPAVASKSGAPARTTDAIVKS